MIHIIVKRTGKTEQNWWEISCHDMIILAEYNNTIITDNKNVDSKMLILNDIQKWVSKMQNWG